MTTRKLIGACLFIAVVLIGCTYWFVKRADERHMDAMIEADMVRRQTEDLAFERIRQEEAREEERRREEQQREFLRKAFR